MSIKKISEMTGLSTATVSYAINNTRNVSESNKAKILAAAREIGYRPNFAAKMLKTQRSYTIALLIPQMEKESSGNLFYMELLGGVKDCLEENEYNMIVSTYTYNDSTEETEKISVLKQHWIDGILLVPDDKSNQEFSEIIDAKLPYVLIHRFVEGVDCSSVTSDNIQAGVDAVNVLINEGCKKIAYLGPNVARSTGFERLEGYKTALRNAGLPIDERIIFSHKISSTENGQKTASELAKMDIDGVFAANHVLGIGALNYMNLHNIKVPDDIAMVCFEDFEWMDITNPPLTAIKQDSYNMGYLAATTLLKKIEGETEEKKLRLPTRIIKRKSHLKNL